MMTISGTAGAKPQGTVGGTAWNLRLVRRLASALVMLGFVICNLTAHVRCSSRSILPTAR